MTDNNRFKLKLFERNVPDEVLINDLKRVASLLGRNNISYNEYGKHGRFNPSTLTNRFGGWGKALEKAGLDVSLSQKFIGILDDQLHENLLHVWENLGRQPQRRDMKPPLSNYSERPYTRSFGGWNKALIRFVEWVNRTDDGIDSTEQNEIITSDAAIAYAHPSHRTFRTINERLRFRILLRDGFTCVRCGKSPLKERGIELEVDHKLAWTLGGETVEENLETLCRVCNNGKSNIAVDYISDSNPK